MLDLSLRAKAAGLVLAVFSAYAVAQEVVEKGNGVSPHQPPAWFSRMASTELNYEPLDFHMPKDRVQGWNGKEPSMAGIKVLCGFEKIDGGFKWQFCDMR